MDRLVVGDVGYGKTEVALRAAFKAVQDGKQVAVLVPDDRPRRAAPRDVLAALRGLPARGPRCCRGSCRPGDAGGDRSRAWPTARVDIVIGTHRLLSARTSGSSDLGLVVVDEEQRFGVAAKERLKQLRREVDVLTLSATPIPRTLNLALAGIRDLSRHRDAARGPAADPDPRRRGVGRARPRRDPARARPRRAGLLRPQPGRDHRGPGRAAAPDAAGRPVRRRPRPDGRGRAREGDDRLRRRRRRRPRVHDDHRVRARHPERQHDHHRPRRHARPGPALPAPRAGRPVVAAGLRLPALPPPRAAVATRRASACRRSSTPRSSAPGFQIALSDLEIRGAGNILGGEQSGHMAAVGFDLYSRLLAEAVEDAQGAMRGPGADRRGAAGRRRPAGRGAPARRLRPRRGPEARALPAPRPGAHDRRPGRVPPGGHRPLRADARPGRSGSSRSPSCGWPPRPPASRRSRARRAGSSSGSARGSPARRRCGCSPARRSPACGRSDVTFASNQVRHPAARRTRARAGR